MTNDETAARLEELLGRATKGDLMTAAHVTKSEYFECPMCDGDGELTATDFCNFDGVAIGVQFYGIGPEFGTHQELWDLALKALPALLSERRALKAQISGLEIAIAATNARHDEELQAARDEVARLRGAEHRCPNCHVKFKRIDDVDRMIDALTANGGEHD